MKGGDHPSSFTALPFPEFEIYPFTAELTESFPVTGWPVLGLNPHHSGVLLHKVPLTTRPPQLTKLRFVNVLKTLPKTYDTYNNVIIKRLNYVQKANFCYVLMTFPWNVIKTSL